MSSGSRSALPGALRARLEAVLSRRLARSVEIVGTASVSGGCIHQTVRLATNVGDDFFLKWSAESIADVFAAEADGLSALRDATDLTVPEVIAHADAGENPAWLLLEYVPPGDANPDYGEHLGESLAALHDAREAPCGWHRSNYIGSLAQANTTMDDWPAFWWTERLEPQIELARTAGRRIVPDQEWAELESKLPTLLAGSAEDGGSLLHGDLWSGNVYPGPDGHPVLVDPAVYVGHREVDLAMTELFGGFPTDFLAAYEARRPLTEGYQSVRRHVYQLYPLLVHVNLFGEAYVDGTARALRTALGSA